MGNGMKYAVKRWLAGIALMLLLADAASAAGPGGAVAESFARPVLAAFEDASTRLAAAAGDLCAAPGAQTLAEARARFGETARAFGRVSVLRFGPLAAGNRFERLFFWPDPRGIALKQVQAALAGADEASAEIGAMAGKSAALQGLPALEFALFGSGAEALADAPAGFRCRFAAAVAANVAAIAGEVAQDWRADAVFARSFADPQAGSEPYRSAGEVDGEIVKALATVAQFVQAAELQPPLGEDATRANGKRAPLWRSDLTFALVAAQLDGARDLLLSANYAASLPAGTGWVPGQIAFGLNTARHALEQVEAPAEQAFANPPDRDRINLALVALDGAGHDVSERLSAALGLTMGFNALDGD